MRRRARGVALFLVLIVLLVLSAAGIGLLFSTSTERSMAATETKVSKTFYAADSGIAFAAASFRDNASYAGGTVPAGLATNTPGKTADFQVVVSAPVFVAYTVQPRDEFQSQGSGYGTTQLVEAAYEVTSTATSDTLQSKKSVTAQLSVYPRQLSSVQP